MRHRMIAPAVVLGLLSILLVPSSGSTTASAQAALPPLLPLHATRGADAHIVDSEGRQVLLRGVNLSALGDYYLPNPAYSAPVPLQPDDFADIAAQGFNTIRLLISWSALEPERDVVSEEYLDQIRDAVAAREAKGCT